MKTNWGRLFSRLFAVTVAARALDALGTFFGQVSGGLTPSFLLYSTLLLAVLMGGAAVLAWCLGDRFCPQVADEQTTDVQTVAQVIVATMASYLIFDYASGFLAQWMRPERLDGARYLDNTAHLCLYGFIVLCSLLPLFNLRRVTAWIAR